MPREEQFLPVVRIADLPHDPQAQRWLVEHLWGESSVGVIGGVPKSSKTWLGLDLALSVATGTACLGKYAVPSNPGESSGFRLRRGRGAGRLAKVSRGAAADPDRRLAQQAMDDLVPVVVLDQLVLLALGIGTLNGKDHGNCSPFPLNFTRQLTLPGSPY
jgi:hypothetical protein